LPESSRKIAIFAFNGELPCFAHALLNAMDMRSKGYDVKLVIEGCATALLPELGDPKKPFSSLFAKVKEAGLIDCVCRACAAQSGGLKSAEEQRLPLCDEMSGHPSMAKYVDMGYTIIVI
jgi:predicted peroxiredoxin